MNAQEILTLSDPAHLGVAGILEFSDEQGTHQEEEEVFKSEESTSHFKNYF